MDDNVSHAGRLDRNCVARARVGSVVDVAADHVAVLTCWHARLQVDIHIEVLHVEGNERLIATPECDLIATIVPPVGHWLASRHVAQDGHVRYLWPAMLAHPAVAARSVTIYFIINFEIF